MTEQVLSIQELSEQTGLPRRTIHFYIQQEIIPGPSGAGLGAYYQHDHLVRLKLIPIFRQQGLRLDDIRQKFKQHSSVELENLLSAAQDRAEKSKPTLLNARIKPPVLPTQQARIYSLSRGVIVTVPQVSQDLMDKIEELCEQLDQKLKQIKE